MTARTFNHVVTAIVSALQVANATMAAAGVSPKIALGVSIGLAFFQSLITQMSNDTEVPK